MRPEVPHSLPDGTWEQMDDVDLHEVFLLRIPILKSCPYFLRGRLRECFATTLRERNRAELAGDIVAKERAWKAFGLVPLLLLHRPRGCGVIGRDELALRADRFARGQWFELLQDAQSHDPVRPSSNPQDQTQENARHTNTHKHSQTLTNTHKHSEVRVERGQVSRARQELTGAALAPKTADTLRELQEKRPVAQMREIPPAVLEYTPERLLDLDADLFGQCLSSAPSGTAPGPGGCANEMLIVCLDDGEVLQLLFRAAEDAARGEMPQSVCRAFMSATMTVLQKKDGGVRGIATGTSFRRFIAKTLTVWEDS